MGRKERLTGRDMQNTGGRRVPGDEKKRKETRKTRKYLQVLC